ncbi:antibiotic biosynthesis monooxygenase [Devosia sp. XK-2]|uniref:antibiotic biosynthesis monooxygenase n=1 Tax=Devosia sp. XK-2 TaxID=3126689 RepID=UPI0030D30A7B
MHTTTRPSTGLTLINLLKVASAHHNELISLLSENIEAVVKQLPGWRESALLVSEDGHSVVISSQWQSAAHVEAMRADPRMQASLNKVRALASFESVLGHLVPTDARNAIDAEV